MKPETVTFSKEVPLTDVVGISIKLGSVLQEITDGERGVVVRIVRTGEMGTVLDCVGDVHIKTGRGTTRVTNRYAQWRHIQNNAQTYEERFESWLKQPYEHDEFKQISKDEGLAVDGIMSLLPDDAVDWDYGPFPDSIETALRLLVNHLTTQTKKK
jgi:hypothetical protein